MLDEEEGGETKLKRCDFLELLDNSCKARYRGTEWAHTIPLGKHDAGNTRQCRHDKLR